MHPLKSIILTALTAASALGAQAFAPQHWSSLKLSGNGGTTPVISDSPAKGAPQTPAISFPTDRIHRATANGTPVKAPAVPGSPNLYGYLYTSYANAGLEKGIYRVYTDKNATFMWQDEYVHDWSMDHVAGWIRDGKMCSITGFVFMGMYMAYCYQECDLNSGEILVYEPIAWAADNQLPILMTAAYCVYDDMIYGYGFNAEGTGYSFTKAPATDISKAECIVEINPDETGQLCTALCYNSQDDMFYGINVDGFFVSIDPEGNQDEIFKIDIPGWESGYYTGLVYSPGEDCYIYNAYCPSNNSIGIYSIDPDEQKITRLFQSNQGQLFRYLVTTDDNAPAGAPAAASVIGHNFAGNALSGTASYTMPGKTQEGKPLSGNLDWELRVNGISKARGTAVAGSTVTAEVTDLTNGNNVFALVTSKDGLKSAPAVFFDWIGSDYANAPTDVRLSETSVSWKPSAGSVHDGYVDFSAIEYVVTLNDEEVARTSGTSAAITLPQGKPFTSYTARVYATYDGKTSEAGVSNFITYGDPIVPPVHFQCTENQLEMMTLINIDGRKDENGKDITWFYTENMGFPAFASGYNGDDWLILPPVNLTDTEHAYRYEMEIGLVHDSDNTGTWELCLGKEPTAEAMTRVIVPATRCYHMLGDIIEEFFAVNEPGVYYIGLHTKTNNVSFHVSDIDLSLSDRAATTPQGVTALAATPGANGALNATVSFTLPEYDAAGNRLAAATDITATIATVSVVPGYPQYDTPVASQAVTGKPGQKYENIEVVTAQNYNEIRVSCTVDGRTGKAETATVYTGVVRPYIVNNLTGTVSADNMSLHLTWTPPTEGEDEGPIGNEFTYEIYYYANAWQYGADVEAGKTEYTYTVNDDAPQGLATIGVMAYNPAGASYHVTGVSAVLGRPYALPMKEDFPGGDETYSGMTTFQPATNTATTSWTMQDPSTITPIFANQSGIALVGYMDQTDSSVKNQKVGLNLPKFSTEGFSDVKFNLSYYSGRYSATFKLYASTVDSTEPELIGEFPSQGKWATHAITLPVKYNDYKWVQLTLEADLPDINTFAILDGYSIDGTTGIDTVGSDTTGTINVDGQLLTVTGFEGNALVVTDLAGRTIVAADKLAATETLTLAPGAYIVRAGVKTAKVIVK